MLERGSSKLAQQSALQEPSIRAESKPSLLDCGLAPTRLVTRSTNASAVSDAPRSGVAGRFGSGAGRVRYSCLKEAAGEGSIMQIQCCWGYEIGFGNRWWS